MGLMDGTAERLNKARELLRAPMGGLNGGSSDFMASSSGASLLITLTECLCIELAALREEVGEVRHAATHISTSVDETRDALTSERRG